MSLFTGKEQGDTYKGILAVSDDNTGITTSLKTVGSADDADSSLSLSTTAAKVAGNLTVTGTITDETASIVGGVGTGFSSITSTALVGALTGNADTATALATARTIGGVSFDGTANITVASATGGFAITGDLNTTGARVTKGWFTDLEVTNAIAGSITGNAATVSTITGLAPDTATTQATQASITTCANLTTVGALNSGSITSGFGAIDVGSSNIDGGTITADTALVGTLSTAAQTNITSVGTLTSLTSSGDIKANTSNYVLEGYSSGRNVFRAIAIRVQPGATPNTNINVTSTALGGNFNAASFTDATNLAASGTSGSFSLDAGGTDLTFNLTEDIVGSMGVTMQRVDVNSSDGLPYYIRTSIASGNVTFILQSSGATTKRSWLGYMDAGDDMIFTALLVTSS